MAKSLNLNKAMVPSQDVLIKNVLTWHALAQTMPAQCATDRQWYPKARMDCVVLCNELNLLGVTVSLDEVIDVVAAVSPGKPWGQNVSDARAAILAWGEVRSEEARMLAYKLHGGGGVGYTWENYRKAWRILDGESKLEPSSEKTFSFSDNIRFGHASKLVTIDQHMIHSICDTGLRGSIGAGGYYSLLANVIIHVAALLGLTPEELQAIIWGCRVALFQAGYTVEDIAVMLSELVFGQ